MHYDSILNALANLIGVSSKTIFGLVGLLIVVGALLCYGLFKDVDAVHKNRVFRYFLLFAGVLFFGMWIPIPKQISPANVSATADGVVQSRTPDIDAKNNKLDSIGKDGSQSSDQKEKPDGNNQELKRQSIRPKAAASIPNPSSSTTVQNSPNSTNLTNNAPNYGPQTICQPGTICNVSPNQGNQGIYYGAKRPAPLLRVETLPLATVDSSKWNDKQWVMSEDAQEGKYSANPGVLLRISANDDFSSPAIRLVCDRRCIVTLADAQTVSGDRLTDDEIRFRVGTISGDAVGIYVLFSMPTGILETQQRILCRVRSIDSDPVKVISVTSYVR